MIRFGLVGAGQAAVKHATALSRIENAELVCFCDINEDKRRQFSQRFGAKPYPSIQDMLRSEKLEVACILTPTGLHMKHVLEAVPYGCPIVVEKPMALRLEDADTMIRACDEHGVKLFVVQQNRFNPPVMKLREAILKKRFGKFVMGTIRVRWTRREDYYRKEPWRGTWQQDGGVLTNQASHHIDMLEWLLGEVETVQAQIATRLLPIEAEDTGAALLRFSNGAVGIIEATVATRPRDLEGSISILGEKGTVVIGGYFMNKLEVWEFEEPLPEDREVRDQHSRTPEIPAWNHEQYLRNVMESIHLGKRGLVDGLEGRKSLELIHAIYESAETGRTISLKFKPEKCRLGISSALG